MKEGREVGRKEVGGGLGEIRFKKDKNVRVGQSYEIRPGSKFWVPCESKERDLLCGICSS